MHRLEVTLPGVASSVPPARHFVERTLEAWELSRITWTAALVVTELAANAALHAGTEFRVVVSLDGDRLRLGVRDASAHLPRTRSHSAESTTGRGLRLVSELAVSWGVEPDEGGKTVWAELSTTASGLDATEEDDVDALLSVLADDVDEPDGTGSERALLRLPAA